MLPNKQFRRDDFLTTDKLQIWPKGHPDHRYCRSDQSDVVQSSLFCQFKLPDYNIDFVTKTKRGESYIQKLYSSQGEPIPSTIGRLNVVREETKEFVDKGRSSSKLHMTKEYSKLAAYLVCYASYRSTLEKYDCNVKLNFGAGLWAENIRFSVAPDSIETYADKTVREVSQYYDYLLESYEAKDVEGN